MNPTVVLIVIALGLVASLIAGIRNARKNPRTNTMEQMRSLAGEEGWSFLTPSGGDKVFVLSHDTWELTGLFFRGGNLAPGKTNHQTEWSAPYEGQERALLGPKLPRIVSAGDLGSDRLQALLQPLFGDRVTLFRGTHRIEELDDAGFTKGFDVFADSRVAAEKVVGNGSTWNNLRALLPAPPVVLVGDGTITIVMRGKLRTATQAQAMIDAGLALLSALGDGR